MEAILNIPTSVSPGDRDKLLEEEAALWDRSCGNSRAVIMCVCLFTFPRAAPMANGDSQARGLIGAVATGLHHSHSDAGSKQHLQPTPQLTATQDP